MDQNLEFKTKNLVKYSFQRISRQNLNDAITCLLNTLFYQRAQGIVELNVKHCENMKNISYVMLWMKMSCGSERVDEAIHDLLQETQSDQEQFCVRHLIRWFWSSSSRKRRTGCCWASGTSWWAARSGWRSGSCPSRSVPRVNKRPFATPF